MNVNWIDGFSVEAHNDGDEVIIRANSEGLRSMAGILLTLAELPDGSHIHLDSYNSLEDGSCGLILEKGTYTES